MKITLPRADLARLLSSTIKVVESRNSIPILSTVRLVADGGKLTATATDLDIEITSAVVAETEEDGALCVSAALLDSIVKKLPPIQDVTLTAEDNTLTVKAGRYISRLQVLPVEDFPSFSADGFTAHFEVDLASVVAPVRFAISTEETRFYLNGVYLIGKTGQITAVATDGHRLSRHIVDQPVSAPACEFSGVILPRKFVGLIPAGGVAVDLSDTKVRVTSGETVITSKLIDGTFPDYDRVIPTGNDKVVTFDSAAMAKAADRVSIVSSERGRAVRLSLIDGQATLVVNNPDSGNATEEIAVSYEGEPIDIGFDCSYLTELIGQFPSGDIRLALNDGGSPAVFTSDKAPGLLAVLMPRRV
ncbi:DNA polymerase III subunit beta [Mesorhizobium sp. NZP2298]|uniref:DNA polymerase III subunit beta n=1 Tax=Mesorhizobium sp. NZP2298 TaxID=2483403 RepID=UPI001555A270|nr:DNA polymerase III subunit beta [Mesorhizobium sp. NZP2298]QKC99209.1 DNA polymerase III subunit beta [Mesorhizobium sp. NZP2298]